jgi:hypothetical protein
MIRFKIGFADSADAACAIQKGKLVKDSFGPYDAAERPVKILARDLYKCVA